MQAHLKERAYPVLSTSINKYVVGQQNFQMGAVIGVLLTIPAVISFIIDRLPTNTKTR